MPTTNGVHEGIRYSRSRSFLDIGQRSFTYQNYNLILSETTEPFVTFESFIIETCNYVVSVCRGFLFLWVLGMGYVILLWHSLSLPYNYFVLKLATNWQSGKGFLFLKQIVLNVLSIP